MNDMISGIFRCRRYRGRHRTVLFARSSSGGIRLDPVSGLADDGTHRVTLRMCFQGLVSVASRRCDSGPSGWPVIFGQAFVGRTS
jgi:hypothetical protein